MISNENKINDVGFIETGFVNDSDVSGSCYLLINSIKIIATVKGPRMLQTFNNFQENVELCNLDCEVKCLGSENESNSANSDNQISNYERQLSTQLKDALTSSIRLDLYLKANISLTVNIMKSSQSLENEDDDDVISHAMDLSAAINGSSLALIDAGIELYDVVISSIIYIDNGTILNKLNKQARKGPTDNDTNKRNKKRDSCVIVYAEMSLIEQITFFLCEGQLPGTDTDIKDNSDVSYVISLDKCFAELHSQCRSHRQVIDNYLKNKSLPLQVK